MKGKESDRAINSESEIYESIDFSEKVRELMEKMKKVLKVNRLTEGFREKG